MNDYIKTSESEFERNSNPKIAAGQKAYMKNRFEFFGIKTPLRREISKPFLQKEFLPDKKYLKKTIKTLWEKPQREFQYFAQELAFKYKKQFEKKDIALFEYMILNKSWWDTVDFIAAKITGEYFKLFPSEIKNVTENWLASGNIWLQRSCLLFQLKYKENTDTELLSHIINKLTGSEEFFINKAIGWILREYGKINPDWVIDFTKKTQLSALSKKEALRIILK
ncbi:MAG: DNA alkylation repair protein [Bacteroidales bacterium]|nr:DNA alkylation repair protein [Bacteroidales bacterium]